MKVGIVNITGYIGMEVGRLLLSHPEVEVSVVTGRSAAGKELPSHLPHLWRLPLKIEEGLRGDVDVIFSALPHGAGFSDIKRALDMGIKVIDLSADFRLRDPRLYEEWYNVSHPFPELLGEAVYGLSELRRDEIRGARLVANPGCYPTGIILSLAPAIKEGIITGDIVVDSKSGVSGAGRTLSLRTHFSEVNENITAYSLEGHRHMPEMVQEMKALGLENIRLTFIPHLVPITRGIFSICYAELKKDIRGEEIFELYAEFYKGEKFVRVRRDAPSLKETLGTNLCLIHPRKDERGGRLVVISVLDNLIKGGAGQAVQNMNIMMGFPEDMGLPLDALYP